MTFPPLSTFLLWQLFYVTFSRYLKLIHIALHCSYIKHCIFAWQQRVYSLLLDKMWWAVTKCRYLMSWKWGWVTVVYYFMANPLLAKRQLFINLSCLFLTLYNVCACVWYTTTGQLESDHRPWDNVANTATQTTPLVELWSQIIWNIAQRIE